MRPITFHIEAKVLDCFLYNGYIFVVNTEGELGYYPISRAASRLAFEHLEYKSLIDIILKRNDYYENVQGKVIFGIRQFSTTFEQLWELAASKINDTIISLDEDDFTVIKEVPTMPVLDMRIYAMKLFLGTANGLYESPVKTEQNKYTLLPSSIYKLSDYRVTRLTAKSGTLFISCASEGLMYGSIGIDGRRTKVIEKSVAPRSFRTAWSGYDIVNYSAQDHFDYFVNQVSNREEKLPYSKFGESPERKQISQVGVKRYGMDEMLHEVNFTKEDISYCFNSSDRGFFLLRDGRFVNTGFGLDKNGRSRLINRLRKMPEGAIINPSIRPLSSCVVMDGCAIEYDDQVLLLQHGETYHIEREPIIGMRSYLASRRYRNILTVVKPDKISIHCLFPFKGKVLDKDDLPF